jgi:hypothetical protein
LNVQRNGQENEVVVESTAERRSARAVRPPERFEPTWPQSRIDHAMFAHVTEPVSFETAMAGSQWKEWKQAMHEEMYSLATNDTWSLTPLPEGRKAIGCRWLYKVKTNQHGEIVKYKARLVAQGFSQVEGIDFDEVYAPVVRGTTLRMLLAMATKFGFYVAQCDIKSAYLHGVLLEEVYMRQPKGFLDSDQPLAVCRLNKGLYGLKQAGRLWNQKLCGTLLDMGFVVSPMDESLYIHPIWLIILAVYVDDLIGAAKDPKRVNEFIQKLKRHFDLT